MKSPSVKTDFVTLPDGQEIFYRVYAPQKIRGSLILVHGLGEHSGRYENFSKYFAKKGWAVLAYDQRGHGKTPGLRCYVNRFQDLVDDLHYIIRKLPKNGGLPKPFLLGHSFGGQVAINFLAQHPKVVKGAILSSPNIKLALEVPLLKRIFGELISNFLPSLSISNEVNPEFISHDQQVVENYNKDRLVQNKITLRMGSEMLSNLHSIMDLAPKIKPPCLLFHGGGDRITSPQGTQDFFNNMKIKDRKLKIYPGFFHETLNEIGKERVYEDIEKWLGGRLH